MADRGIVAELARYYDLDMLDIAEDVEMYLALARDTGGPVLELAAGSGRIAVPLGRAGHRVVAVDRDPAMLALARASWERTTEGTGAGGPATGGSLETVESDLTLYRSHERFGLAILALNTFLLLPDDQTRVAALVTMRSHLRPGGLAVVDIVTPGDDELATFDGRLQLEWVRRDHERDETVAKLISARLDPEAGEVALTQLFDATPDAGGAVRRVLREDTLHLVDAPGLQALAAAAGLDGADLRGDHRLTTYAPGSPRAILLGRLL